MKKLYYIICLILISCYNEDAEVVDSPNTSHRASEVTTIIKSITAHYGAFDDHIDMSSCLSLMYPYQLVVNNEERTIHSQADVLDINEEDNIEVLFPIEALFYNYEEHNASTLSAWNLMTQNCQEDFMLRVNNCLDFEYPISIKKYNDLTGNFDTSHLMNDKEAYLHFENLHINDLYEIDYPISIIDHTNTRTTVQSDVELTSMYRTSLEICN